MFIEKPQLQYKSEPLIWPLSSVGQFGSQGRQHKGNGKTQLALCPPALIILPIRPKKTRCSCGYIMDHLSCLCPKV